MGHELGEDLSDQRRSKF